MRFRIGLENNFEGRSLAWVLEHPGCFAYGTNGKAALQVLPQEIKEYALWIDQRSQGTPWLVVEDVEIELEETWDNYTIDENFDRSQDGYDVNAWFLHDWKPLSEQDVSRGLQLLEWTREDLLKIVSPLSPQQLEVRYPAERWNISGILRHIGGAEWWYLDRLGLSFPRQLVPTQPLNRLVVVRKHLNTILPTFVGSRQVVGIDGEIWSPRKVLRRAVWHERDHIFHIQKLLEQNPQG
jgi:hypothetical protein